MEASAVQQAKLLARTCLEGTLTRRWRHVQAVGEAAEQLRPVIGERVVAAAWLHDVGYGPQQVDTGFHSLDGARYLRRLGIDPAVVSLVAHHSGAQYEALERGLSAELGDFAWPDLDDLDALTFVDMTTGPDGVRVSAPVRIAQILQRYASDDPVHRAVTAAAPALLASASRAAHRLGLPDEGVAPPA